VRLTVYNGVHVDGFAPQVLTEWKAFLDLHVAKKKPFISDQIRGLAPILFSMVFHSAMPLPPDRFGGFQGYDDAMAAYAAEPTLRVIFENGAGGTDVGAPQGTFEKKYPSWPPPPTQVQRWYFQADGTMASMPPTDVASASQFQLDPTAGARG